VKTKNKQEPKEIMDRTALKAIASQLKEAGADFKVLKIDTDDSLQKKVNEALHALPSAGVATQLDSIIPEKLQTVLKRDCLGVFIDLSDVSCVRCTHVQTCVRDYLSNLNGDKLLALKPAMVGQVVEESKTVVKRASTSAADVPKKPAKITYEPDRVLFVKNMKHPNPKKSAGYDTIQAILDEVPGTMSEMREIIDRDFEQTDKEFITFLNSLREVGMIKLVIDLSEENKAELRAAGFEI
jgi:hypothetical protein